MSVPTRNLVGELETAYRLLLDVYRRWRTADDAVIALLTGPGYSEREHLAATLEVAHAHMVGRDLAERAVMATIDAPRPRNGDREEARRLLGFVLAEYGWHRSSLERTVRTVSERRESGAVRYAGRAAAPVPAVRALNAAGRRSAGR